MKKIASLIVLCLAVCLPSCAHRDSGGIPAPPATHRAEVTDVFHGVVVFADPDRGHRQSMVGDGGEWIRILGALRGLERILQPADRGQKLGVPHQEIRFVRCLLERTAKSDLGRDPRTTRDPRDAPQR